MNTIKNIEHFTIARVDGMRFYFPDICRAGEDVAISFRESPDRRLTRQHIDPCSHASIITGGNPAEFSAENRHIVSCLSGIGTYPCLTHMGGEDFALTDMRWEISPDLPDEDHQFNELGWPASFDGSYYIPVSFDGGATRHGAPRKISVPEYPKVGVVGSLIKTDGNEYLLAADVDRDCLPDERDEPCIILMRTTDLHIWELFSVITSASTQPRGVLLCEPCVKRMSDGRLLCAMRSFGTAEDSIFISESRDMGRTWSRATPIPLSGHPPFILELPDGRVMLLYGKRHRPPFGVALCISNDGGRSWNPDDELLIREDGASNDVGYPRAAIMPDGSIFSVYYMTHDFRHGIIGNAKTNCPHCDQEVQIHQCGTYSVRSICGTRITLL